MDSRKRRWVGHHHTMVAETWRLRCRGQ
jgi:hypothetical protein